jgi:hypothetical protein
LGARHQTRRFIRPFKVGLDGGGFPAQGADFLDGRLRFLGGGSVMDDNVGAGLDQGVDQRSPDAAGASGDQSDVAGPSRLIHRFHSITTLLRRAIAFGAGDRAGIIMSKAGSGYR